MCHRSRNHLNLQVIRNTFRHNTCISSILTNIQILHFSAGASMSKVTSILNVVSTTPSSSECNIIVGLFPQSIISNWHTSFLHQSTGRSVREAVSPTPRTPTTQTTGHPTTDIILRHARVCYQKSTMPDGDQPTLPTTHPCPYLPTNAAGPQLQSRLPPKATSDSYQAPHAALPTHLDTQTPHPTLRRSLPSPSTCDTQSSTNAYTQPKAS